MKRYYTEVVERDSQSNWLVGEVVDLPGCNIHVPDLSALETAVQEAICVYVQTAEPDEPLAEFVGAWRVEVTM